MPKLKTHKAIRKRFRITGRGKLIRRSAGQDHFNARDPGKVTTRKRRDHELDKTNYPAVKKMIHH